MKFQSISLVLLAAGVGCRPTGRVVPSSLWIAACWTPMVFSAELTGTKTSVIGDSASLVLDALAAMLSGLETKLADSSSAANMVVRASGVDVAGPKVGVAGTGETSISGAMLKLNA